MSLKSFFHNICNRRKDALSIQDVVRACNANYQTSFAAYRNQAILAYNQLFINNACYGLSNEKLCESEVIVSLTTFGSRIEKVYLTIESIMQGVVKPNRIILWLANDEFSMETIPATLLKQKERGLQIEFCEDIRSYKKLIPTLRNYPEACIVTIDDDVMYEIDFLDKLLRSHKQHPDCVCVNVARRVNVDAANRVPQYKAWQHILDEKKAESPCVFGIGIGGILYPAHSLHEEVLNQEAFMKLSPYGDDIWFYAMALKNGTSTIKQHTLCTDGDYVDIYDNAPESLSELNCSQSACRNDDQIKAVFDQYQLWDKLK